MWRLFEVYVGVQLAKNGRHFKSQTQYTLPFMVNGKQVGAIQFRPDYYSLEDEGIVVDAKYKSIIDSSIPEEESLINLSGLPFANGVQPSNVDVCQIIACCDLIAVKNPGYVFKAAIFMAPGAPRSKEKIADRLEWNEFIEGSATLDL